MSLIQLVMKYRLTDIQSTTLSTGPAMEKVISSGNSLRKGSTAPTIRRSAITPTPIACAGYLETRALSLSLKAPSVIGEVGGALLDVVGPVRARA